MSNVFNRTGMLGGGGDTPRFPRLDFTQRNPQTEAILSKLLPDPKRTPSIDANGKKHVTPPDVGLLNRIAEQSANNNNDAESMFQLLPELELARQILVSSILSPKDMVTTELNYSVEDSIFDTELNGAMLQVISEHFNKVYKIESILPTILSDILFMKGSYPLVILPENSIDEAINSPYRISTEALRDEIAPDGSPVQIGLLGNPGKAKMRNGVALENFANIGKPASFEVSVGAKELKRGDKTVKFDTLLSVTDNPSVLKFPALNAKAREDRIQDLLSSRKVGSVALEGRRERRMQRKAFSSANETELSLYRRRQYGYVPVLQVKTRDQLSRAAVGHPLVMHMPSEAVIPVHVPGNPKEHVGYFVLLDEFGNPVTRAQETDYYNQLATNINNRSQTSQLLNTTARAQEGREPDQLRDLEDMVRAYTDMVEQDLLQRLQNGVYGDGSVEVAKPQEVYRIMFARAAASMQTQLLYIPTQLMTYFAFDYNKWGVGASLLENSKILGGLRSILLFANTMATVKNSVGRTGVKIHLDPNDQDPTGTVETLMHEYAKTRQSSYPLGASNPADIISFLQNAAIDLAVEGNTAYPETTFNTEDRSSQKAMVDSEQEERLKKSHIMSLGLSPEAVDATQNVEFAASVVSSNLLLSKRVLMYQDMFTNFLADFIHAYVKNSGTLMTELLKILEDNQDKLSEEERGVEPELLIIEFINSVQVKLPAPDAATLENQMKAYQTYTEALEAALNAYFSEDFLATDSLGVEADHIPAIKAAIKAHYQRQWLRNNNVMPELNDLTLFDEKEGAAFNLLDNVESHLEGLAKSVEGYVKRMQEAKAKRDKLLQDQAEALGVPTSDGGGSTGGDQSGGEGGDSDFDFGGGIDDNSGSSDTGDSNSSGDVDTAGTGTDDTGATGGDNTEAGGTDEGTDSNANADENPEEETDEDTNPPANP